MKSKDVNKDRCSSESRGGSEETHKSFIFRL